MNGEKLLLAILVGASFLYSAIQSSRFRRKIQDRANRDYSNGSRPNADELDSRLGDIELMYEDLEQSYWAHVGALVGLCAYFYYHLWYVSVVVGIGLAFLGWKFIAIRPFTNRIPDIVDD